MGHADVANAAGGLPFAQRRQVSAPVEQVVDLQQVHALGAESPERLLDLLHGRLKRSPAKLVTGIEIIDVVREHGQGVIIDRNLGRHGPFDLVVVADGIIAYDVSEQLVITDAFVLCSASNDRQVRAIVDEIERVIRKPAYGGKSR